MPSPAKSTVEKRALLRSIEAMISPSHQPAPLTLSAALARADVPAGTFFRWCKEEASGTWDKPKSKGGRPASFALTEAETAGLRWFALKHDSAEFGVKAWASYARPDQLRKPNGDRECPHEPGRPEIRQRILDGIDAARKAGKRYEAPLSLMRAAYVTDADRALFRGDRPALSSQLRVPHKATWINEAGVELPLLAGVLYVSDDWDNNAPGVYQKECGGLDISRQNLSTMDVRSLAWLHNSGVTRVKNAYRKEDIAAHMEGVVETHGWPAGWLIERGPWDNTFIHGCPVPAEWGEADNFKWGGINGFTRVQEKFEPTGKTEIEQGFNRLQKCLAHKSVDVGRRRGEFQKATALVDRVRAGDIAAARQFWTLVQAADAIADAMEQDNLTDHAREALGGKRMVPAECWHAEAPGVTTPLKAGDRWVFAPLKLPRTVRRDGTVKVTCADYGTVLYFQVSGVFRGLQELDHGHRLFLAFHPGQPERGASVFNAERATARNRDGLGFSEFLGLAPMVERAARADFSKGGDFTRQQTRSAAVRSEFRAIMPGRGVVADRSEATRSNGDRGLVVRKGTDPVPAVTPVDMETTDAPAPRRERGGVADLLRRRGTGTPAPVPVTAGGEDDDSDFD